MCDARVSPQQTVENLAAAARLGNEEELRRILNTMTWSAAPMTRALKEAASSGHAGCVKILLAGGCSSIDTFPALDMAAQRGHQECLALLIPFTTLAADKSGALLTAAINGHTECVKILLAVSDPRYLESIALQMAAYYGHLECVKLLIPISDNHTFALQRAMFNKRVDCMDVLFAHSDPYQALAWFKRTSPHEKQEVTFLEEWICNKERKTLTQSLDGNPTLLEKSRKM